MKKLTIANTEVRQDSAGRYCLNDLHRAAGGEKRHAPNEFFRLGTTADLVEELTGDSRFGPIRSARGGSKPGTYVCKELVYAYAMWISPAFHLKVIQAYDTLQTQGVAVAENAAEDFIKNPLDYFGKLLEQAKRLQERNKSLEADLYIAQTKADIVDRTFGKEDGEQLVALGKFVRRLDRVNTMAVRKNLMSMGYLYRKAGKYRVYSKYRHVFKEKSNAQTGFSDIFLTLKGQCLVTELYGRGQLTLLKRFQ